MKQKKNFLSVFVLILSLCVLSVGGYSLWKVMGSGAKSEAPVIHTGAYYSIRKNATNLQVELYEKLVAAIEDEASDEVIGGLVAQNFIADFFTFSNKLRINDIGGIQFVDETIKTNFYKQVKETIYTALLDPLDKNTMADTLEVETMTVVSQEPIEFVMLGEEDSTGNRPETTVDAIEVDLTWTYTETSAFDTGVYDKEARIVLIKGSSGLYYVVEVNYVQGQA